MKTIKHNSIENTTSTNQLNEFDSEAPYLLPIENPGDKNLELAYESSKKYYGKVITPLKVLLARMPADYCNFYLKIGQLDNELQLPRELALLIRGQVARINVCLFCMDSARFALLSSQIKPEKIEDLAHYRTSILYSDAERAALDYATELATERQMRKETFQQLAKYFSEREICDIVYIIASEHVYNITNIGLNIHSDNICNTTWKRQS